MTNSESIIIDLEGIANILIREDLCSITPIEKAISALKENDKLKAEVEQLKQNIIDGANDTYSLQKLDHELLTKEIEQLKSELEQSVKLSCRVGDDIYFRLKGTNPFAEYVDFIQTQKITRINIDKDGILYCSATEKFIETDIGKTIFITREEARRSGTTFER